MLKANHPIKKYLNCFGRAPLLSERYHSPDNPLRRQGSGLHQSSASARKTNSGLQPRKLSGLCPSRQRSGRHARRHLSTEHLFTQSSALRTKAPAWFLYAVPTALALLHASASGVTAMPSLTGLVMPQRLATIKP
ncbi:MAG: hypothetical protein RIE86_00445 [Imperialibacter sp.]|uniref:hypothetical protein n=1 Tax=Imperialibacter sp. TaxID=2038411 RepID=UPI0032F063BF